MLKSLINQTKEKDCLVFSNRITRDGAVYLAPMLEQCGLLRLNLAYNRLENEGAGHLATALLQSNSRLRRYKRFIMK
jgi:hypothetical protein